MTTARMTADELAESMYSRGNNNAVRRHAAQTGFGVVWLTAKQAKYLADLSRGRIPFDEQRRDRSGLKEVAAGTLPCGKLWSMSIDRNGAGRLEVFEGRVS